MATEEWELSRGDRVRDVRTHERGTILNAHGMIAVRLDEPDQHGHDIVYYDDPRSLEIVIDEEWYDQPWSVFGLAAFTAITVVVAVYVVAYIFEVWK